MTRPSSLASGSRIVIRCELSPPTQVAMRVWGIKILFRSSSTPSRIVKMVSFLGRTSRVLSSMRRFGTRVHRVPVGTPVGTSELGPTSPVGQPNFGSHCARCDTRRRHRRGGSTSCEISSAIAARVLVTFATTVQPVAAFISGGSTGPRAFGATQPQIPPVSGGLGEPQLRAWGRDRLRR